MSHYYSDECWCNVDVILTTCSVSCSVMMYTCSTHTACDTHSHTHNSCIQISAVERGGATVFTELGLRIAPSKVCFALINFWALYMHVHVNVWVFINCLLLFPGRCYILVELEKIGRGWPSNPACWVSCASGLKMGWVTSWLLPWLYISFGFFIVDRVQIMINFTSFFAVCNKWIHERGQEFRRQCDLNKNL